MKKIAENPNIRIYHITHSCSCGRGCTHTIPYMLIRKDREEEDDSCSSLLMAIHRLKSDEIKFVIVNKIAFEKKSFQFKTTGNFNTSKAIDVLTWQYHIDILDEIIKA